ncbi:MAG: phosphohydrolase [Eubacteriales bacterium]
MNPKPEELCIVDIAHALSMMCRANGHFHTFYSVAQHCINCYREAAARGYSEKVQLACLLHDASEAYLSDVTRPVKQHLDGYREAEKLLQDMIYAKWLSEPLDEDETQQIKQVDDVLLYFEFLHYMNEKILADEPIIKSGPVFEYEIINDVKSNFLNIFKTENHNK